MHPGEDGSGRGMRRDNLGLRRGRGIGELLAEGQLWVSRCTRETWLRGELSCGAVRSDELRLTSVIDGKAPTAHLTSVPPDSIAVGIDRAPVVCSTMD